jgi:hypothetical protein
VLTISQSRPICSRLNWLDTERSKALGFSLRLSFFNNPCVRSVKSVADFVYLPLARAAFTLTRSSCAGCCTGPEIFTASCNTSRASETLLNLA